MFIEIKCRECQAASQFIDELAQHKGELLCVIGGYVQNVVMKQTAQ